MREGAETPLFKQNFTDWLNKGEITGLPKYEKKGECLLCVDVVLCYDGDLMMGASLYLLHASAVREEMKVEGASMHKQATRESQKMVDDGSGKIEVRGEPPTNRRLALLCR